MSESGGWALWTSMFVPIAKIPLPPGFIPPASRRLPRRLPVGRHGSIRLTRRLWLIARRDGKVRGSPSWHKTVVPFASGQFYTDSGRLTDALCP